MKPRMAWVAGWLVAGVLLGCGDGQTEPGPVAPPTPDPAAPGQAAGVALPPVPLRRHVDAYRFTVECIRAGDLDALRSLEMPPRVDRADLGVHLLLDTLLGNATAPADLPSLLDGLAALLEAPGDVGRKGLETMLPLWRDWTPEQVEQARRYAAWRRDLERYMERAGTTNPDGTPRGEVALAPEGEPAPGCPFAPAAPFVQAVRLARDTPPGPLPPAFERAVTASLDGFRALGWPQGFAHLVMPWLHNRRETAWRTGPERLRIGDLALTAFQESGNRVGEAGVHLRRADEMAQGRFGPATAALLDSAAKNAEDAVRLMTEAGDSGPDLVDAYLLAARCRLRSGAFEKAADHARSAGALADELGMGDKGALVAGSLEIPALGRAALFEQVVRRAEEYWKRTWSDAALREVGALRGSVAEAAAVAMVAAGEKSAALVWLDRAAEVYADGNTPGQPAMTHVQALDIALQLGEADARWATVESDLAASQCPPQVVAAAADVLFDHGQVARASALLARLNAVPEDVAAYFRARVTAASGETSAARSHFASALQRMTGDRDAPLGRRVARVATKWSEFEEAQGNLPTATWLASKASYHLQNAGEPADEHTAALRYLRLERRRLEFERAGYPISVLRRMNRPTSHPGEQDARLDEALVLLELTLGRDDPVAALPDAEKVLDVRVPGKDRQDLLKALLRAAATGDGAGLADASIRGAAGRWQHPLGDLAELLASPASAPLADFVARAVAVVEAAGPGEPEMRRLAARAALLRLVPEEGALEWDPRAAAPVAGVPVASLFTLLEARRATFGALPAAGFAELAGSLGEGTVFRGFEPLDARVTLRLTVTGTAARLERDAGATALAAFASEVDDLRSPQPRRAPAWPRLVATARAAFDAVTAGLPEGTTDVVVSIGPPLGALPLELGRPAVGAGPALWFARSASERVAAAALFPTNAVQRLDFPDSPLASRHALVLLAPFDVGGLRAFHEAVVQQRKATNSTPAAAVRAVVAKERAAWKPEGAVTIPLWAAVGVRGAP